MHKIPLVHLTGNSAASAQLGTAGHDTVVPPCIKWTILGKCKNITVWWYVSRLLDHCPFTPSILRRNHIKRRQRRRFSLPSWPSLLLKTYFWKLFAFHVSILSTFGPCQMSLQPLYGALRPNATHIF